MLVCCSLLEGKGQGNFPFENEQMNKIYVLIIVFEVWVQEKISTHVPYVQKRKKMGYFVNLQKSFDDIKNLWMWTFWRYSLRNLGIFHQYWLQEKRKIPCFEVHKNTCIKVITNKQINKTKINQEAKIYVRIENLAGYREHWNK